jgi:DNA processing protein
VGVFVPRLPDEAFVVALARLPKVGPARLRSLLERYEPEEAWSHVRCGSVDPVVVVNPGRAGPAAIIAGWKRAAETLDPLAYWRAHIEADIGVVVLGSETFPSVFAEDDDPPAVLFWKGDIDHLAGTRVGIVGTRKATRYGTDVANSMARDLSEAGIAVVSGLALGIDGAAHSGAVMAGGAPPIAVVGCGLDRVYPREHRALWRRVAEVGVVISEYPLGAPAAAWQFPARNRLIAALCDVLVVVESQCTGGALGTAVEAARRSRPVLAVPGPVTAPSSAGTNQLLFDGCSPARDATDVLLALGREPAARRRASEHRILPTGDAASVLEQLPWHAVSVEHVVISTSLSLGTVALALEALECDGWITQRAGWVERLGRASGSL